ncbi:MAG: DNA repair protein RecN [Clostridia bacterium]|nr:DNA repair protein RecN [Clostridia bacterium]
MLSQLTIKNVALIESATIDFSEGLNVLSGETGAGKSVILDSVNFVLGAKADRTMIRHGESECFVKAEFTLPETAKAITLLREMDIDSDGEIIISRRFSEAGKSTVKINGNTVSTSMLRQITDCLVDVHGQSEHFFLLKESNQLRTLDAAIGDVVAQKKAELAALLLERKTIDGQIAQLGGDEQARSRRLDMLSFQIDEIESAELKDGEEEELLAKRNMINNVEKILQALKGAVDAFSAESGALDALRYAKRCVGGIAKLSPSYEEISNRLENLYSEADDISETLIGFADELYFDENEAQATEERLDLIRSLKKKYGNSVAEINSYLSNIRAEYDLLSDCEGQVAKLMERREKSNQKIYQCCVAITKIRKQFGKNFCQEVAEELRTLNIASARFEIEFGEYTEEDVERADKNGLDEVCFLFSANAGEPLKPLGKIISGGEMSRFMLALKTKLSSINEICTYLFDEIDAGISGKTAKVVGEKFARIAQSTQIIAVSHLAQIAAMSDREFLIEKQEIEGKTITKVRALDEKEKVLELVRLLGGDEKDAYAVGHAEELLKQAENYKSTLT